MESLHGPINQCTFGEENYLNGGVQQESTSFDMEDNIPFLQMLQRVETPLAESSSSFQVLLKLQPQKRAWPWPWSGIDHDDDHLYTTESKVEAAISAQIQVVEPSPQVNRRKRKKTKPPKNQEEIESHRMTHIAVERNRRRQMNDHLTELRSLMPPSYVQRGDQASIIGGAIDFIKELEQLLQSLQAQKRLRKATSTEGCETSIPCLSPCSSSTQCEKKLEGINGDDDENGRMLGGLRAESKSMVADVQVTLIHNHVNLKIRCVKRSGQLIKAIMALEDLRLTVLHLNVTSLETSVHYSFSLKIEDDCRLKSAIEIAEAIHQIFRLINGC